MKTIGLLGGMSWESSLEYYRIINEEIKIRLSGLHSAKVILNSVDFAEIEALQSKGDWNSIGEHLAQDAVNIEKAGADFLLICTNTMHKVMPIIESKINIPILHIADATAEVMKKDGIKTVGLLGTAFTMEQDFYKDRLSEKFGLNVITPDTPDRQIIHNVIYKELCLGIIKDSSKNEYLRIIDKLKEKGAEAVILGCTEIGILIRQTDTDMKLYDTTLIHARKAIEYALT